MSTTGQQLAMQRRRVSASVTRLLDETGLGSAAAAYSVRLLRAAYTGYFARIRRISDSAEADFGDDGTGWLTASSTAANSTGAGAYDGQTLSTFCSGTDGVVASWFDQSGNTRTMTQGTAARQPTIVSAGALVTGANSKAAVTCVAADIDFLSASFTIASSPQTGVQVLKQRTWTSGKFVYSGYTASTVNIRMSSSSPQLHLADSAALRCNTGSLAVGSWGVMTWVADGANTLIRGNAGTAGTAATFNVTAAGGVCLNNSGNSGASCSDSDFQETVVWASSLGTTAQTTARDNINAAFALY